MHTINANAVRGCSYEIFFTLKFIIRKFLYMKISISMVHWTKASYCINVMIFSSPTFPLTLSIYYFPLSLSSQLSQVYTTFVNKTTGQLSVITSFLNWSGTAARIFTTLQETQDPIILIMYTSSFIVNSIIMLQFGIYWNATSKRQ